MSEIEARRRLVIRIPEIRIPTKKNALRPRGRDSYGQRLKGYRYDTELKAALNAIATYCRIAWGSRQPILDPDIWVTFQTTLAAQDRDGMLTTVLDCLVEARVLHDDRIAKCNGRIIVEPAVLVEDQKQIVTTVQLVWKAED